MRVRMTIAIGLVLMLGVGSAWAGPAAGDSPAMARARLLVNAFQAVKGGEKDKPLSKADATHNQGVYTAIDGYFDLDGIVAAAIEGREKAFDAKQLTRYQAAFKELLRLVGYRGAGRFVRKARWSVKEGGQKAGLAEVVVLAALPEDELEIEVGFRWAGEGDKLRVRDVAFDGDSLTLDYRNQFGRILDKEGAKGLLDRLEKRLAEEQRVQ